MPPSSSLRTVGSPVVALVGRPNVGKSHLLNALTGAQTAIVSPLSGTTRDRLTALVEFEGRSLRVVDTGGLVSEAETAMDVQVAWQAAQAIADADVLVLVADATQGVTHGDEHVAQLLRQSGRPVVVAVNKVDTRTHEPLAHEFHALGLGEVVPLSAYHRHGLEELLEAVIALVPASDGQDTEGSASRFAIVGRPNAGKSALVNAILGMERSIVSEVPGTTRDAVDSPFVHGQWPAVLTDTAGIRRRGAIAQGIERYSVLRAIRAIDRSDVAILVVDATEMVTSQDLHIAGQVMESFKGMVVALNKWDLMTPDVEDEVEAHREVLRRLRFMDYVPVQCTSAVTGDGVHALVDTAFRVREEWGRWVEPRLLQRTVMDAVANHLPRQGRRSLKLYRITQESTEPPTFVFYCNNPDLVHFSYERYLENTIRRAFGFEGTHLRLEFRGRGRLHVIGAHRRPRKSSVGERRGVGQPDSRRGGRKA